MSDLSVYLAEQEVSDPYVLVNVEDNDTKIPVYLPIRTSRLFLSLAFALVAHVLQDYYVGWF